MKNRSEQDIGRIRPGNYLSRVYLRLAVAALLPFFLFPAQMRAAETGTAPCPSSAGPVEFPQTPCADDTEVQETWVEELKRSQESARTKVEQGPEERPDTEDRKPEAAQEADSVLARKKEKCEEKNLLLEAVNRKLRQGHGPAVSAKLRRKRQVYKDYIRRFCS